MNAVWGILVVGVIFVGYCIYYAVTHKDEETNQELSDIPDEDPVAETPSEATPKRTKGLVCGTLGMIYMAGYAFYVNSTINGAEVTNLGEAIGKAAAIKMFTPFFYCLVASALLSFVGIVGKNKMFVLLALAATIGAFFIVPGSIEMLIAPALLFLISFVRMAKK